MTTLRQSLLSLAAAFALAGGAAALAATAAPATPPQPVQPAGGSTGTGATQPMRGPQPIVIKDVQAREDAAFKAADTNGDGKLSLDEFLAMKRPDGANGARGGMGGQMGGGHGMWGRGLMMGGRDGDGCGKKDWMPTAEERAKFQHDLFDAMDTDHNGQLSRAEFDNGRDAAKTVMRKAIFARLDKNHDGYLTRDELPSFAARLQQADANHDGIVTPDEMRAARDAARAQCADKQPE